MFNEILTGKATLEPDRSATPAPPPPEVEVAKTSGVARSPAFDEQRYVREAARRAHESEQNWRAVRWIVLFVIGLVLALFKAAALQTQG